MEQATTPDGKSTPTCAAATFVGVADGVSVIPVLVKTSPPATETGAGGASPVDLHLFLSSGRWLTPEGTTSASPSSLDATVIDGTTFSAAFIVGTAVTPTWISASRGNATSTIEVPMVAAPIDGVSVQASPALLHAASANQSQLTVRPLVGNGGVASEGTPVALSVTSSPWVPGLEIFPTTAQVDATGTAVATLAFVPRPPSGDGGAPYDGPETITVTAAVSAGSSGDTTYGTVSIAVAP